MKTPREIFLKQHQAARPKLDHLCAEVLQSELGWKKSSAVAWPAVLAKIPFLLWRELIFPCRQVWAGLAVAWLLIAAANVTTRSPAPAIVAQSSLASEPLVAWRQQELLLDELAGWGGMLVEHPPRSFSPRPSSRRRVELFNV